MLVLTRKPGQSIVVFGEQDKPICRIVVMQSQAGKVKIGIEADEGIEILREEIWDGQESG